MKILKAIYKKNMTVIYCFYDQSDAFCGFWYSNNIPIFSTINQTMIDTIPVTWDSVGDYAKKYFGKIDYNYVVPDGDEQRFYKIFETIGKY